jgi:hypothetical protein
LLIIFGVPAALSRSSWVNAAIASFGGMDPLRVQVGSIRIGWFEPAVLEDVRLIDGRDREAVQIARIETEMSLWKVITNRNDLGTLTIIEPVANVEVEPGGSSLEEALKPFLDQPASESNTIISGRIVVEDAQVNLVDSVTSEAWLVSIKNLSMQLPVNGEMIGKTRLLGGVQSLRRLEGGRTPSTGNFELTISPIPAEQLPVNYDPAGAAAFTPLEIDLIANQLPLEFSQVLKRRLPELPYESIGGEISMRLQGAATSANQWNLTAQNIQGSNLDVAAKDFLGAKGARLTQLVATGRVELSGDLLTAQGLELVSDAGQLKGNAIVPWPIPIPSATHPWIEDATLDLSGEIDVARLAQIAPDLLVLQENTQVTQGRITLQASQEIGTDSLPTGHYEVKLGGLEAMVSGSAMRWDEALEATVDVLPSVDGQPKFTARCDSEFCTIDGSGDFRGGQINAIVDLDRFHQRMSNWLAMPIDRLSGTAKLNTQWKRESMNRLTATGQLVTTPLTIDLPSGTMNEPAWKGSFEVVGRTIGNQLQQLDRAQLSLSAEGESLEVQIVEPIALMAGPPEIESMPPAAATLKLVGDLAGWQRRGELIAAMDFGVDLQGRCDLTASGKANATGLQIERANWTAQPFALETNGFAFNESQLVGSFEGLVDTNNIAQLVVSNCILQSETFAMSASDSAGPNGNRIGQASYAANPNRLMAALQGVGSNGNPPVQADGQITGTMQWAINAEKVDFSIEASGDQIAFFQSALAPQPGQLVSASTGSERQLLWKEPQAKSKVVGSYAIETGDLTMSETQLQTEWIAYGGKADVTTVQIEGISETRVHAMGDCVYDAAQVTRRLKPFVGEYFVASGTRTEPVDLVWTSNSLATDDPNAWADQLQAKTKIGWESARVLGIDIGKADVDLEVRDGQFVSKTDIPVSQGTLRWDLDGNLAGDPIRIHQAPQKVLDNVAITPLMCQGWLKYVAPIMAEVTQVEGRLSLDIANAEIVPTNLSQQKISGKLLVHSATVGPGPLADQLLVIVNQVRALKNGDLAGATNPQKTWLNMPDQNIDFSVDAGRVFHKDLRIDAGEVTITTSGSVNVTGDMEMTASIPIKDEWIAKTPLLASLKGQSLTVPISGNISRPQLDMRAFTGVATQVATGAAQGYLQQQVDKGLNKLLGPMQEKLQNASPLPNLQGPNGLLPEGGLPKGLLPEGLFPGFGGSGK